MNKCLSLDLETASEVDLEQCGIDVYARHPSTRVLMLAYAVDDGAVHQWLPLEGPMPAKLRAALTGSRYLKTAFNATFERAILKHVLGIDSPLDQWEDTMVMANIMALPGNLDGLGKALKLGPEFQKDGRGKALIKYFCQPRKPTKAKPWVWADHLNSPTEWKEFCEYNVQDVVVERKARSLLKKYPIQPWEWDDWRLDQKINERGVPVDLELVNQAIRIAKIVREKFKAQLIEITGLKNPGSVQQFLPWAQARGYPFSELRKDRIKIALNDFRDAMTADCIKALELRLKAEKSSLKKFPAMLRANWEGVVRFMFQFSGAGRTGRWAGRIVQLQNLARGRKDVLAFLEDAREMVRAGEIELVSALWDNPLDVLSTLLRSAFCAPEGYKFVIADLSAIESRVIGWLARCETLLNVFREGKDPYQAFAVHLFKKPYEEITKQERNDAKAPVLGGGYRLGGGDLVGEYPDQKKTGLWGYAENMGIELTKEECHRAVQVFRETYPEIVQLWYDLENAVSRVMSGEGPQRVGPVTFALKPPFLLARLPSGRCLFYCRPKMEQKKRTWPDGRTTTKLQLTYEGIHQTTKKWVRMDTHGGKLVENLVQAIANDILRHGLRKADAAGFPIVLHVHDEIGALVRRNDPKLTVEALEACMTDPPEWAKTLPLGAEGFESVFYKKG